MPAHIRSQTREYAVLLLGRMKRRLIGSSWSCSNRGADSGGYTFWLGELQDARCADTNTVQAELDWISSNFVNSAEFQARGLSNQAFVCALYRGLYRREADTDGLLYWTQQLNSGAMTRDQVRAAFVYFSEFYNGTVAPTIGESCVP